METGHQPFHSELEDSADILQDGDTLIRSSLGSSGGLDGVSGLEGCVLAGANAPGFTQVPRVHGWGKVYQFILCFGLSTAPQVFTRVMAPVSAILHRMGVRLRRYLADWLLRAFSREQVLLALRPVLQLCRRLGIVVNWEKSQVIRLSRWYIWESSWTRCFRGFSCLEESREASLHWRRILVLRQSASVIWAGVIRGAVLNVPTYSWGFAYAVRFRPVGSGRRRALDQCPGALGDRECSQVVCSTSCRFLSGGLRRQIDSRVVSAEPRRDSFFFSELRRSEGSPLGGGSVCGDFPTGYYGETQCASGRSFSPKPGLGLRVDAEAGGLQGFVQEVAGVSRPVCNVSKSQLFLIFFSLPQSQCYGDGCASLKLEWVAGVCFSSLVSHSGGLKKLRSSSGVLLTSGLHIGLRGRGFRIFWVWWSTARSLFHSPETFCVSPTSTGFIWECPGCLHAW